MRSRSKQIIEEEDLGPGAATHSAVWHRMQVTEDLQPNRQVSTHSRALRLFRMHALDGLKRTFFPSLLAYTTLIMLFSVIIPTFFVTQSPGDTARQVVEFGGVFLLGIVTTVPVLLYASSMFAIHAALNIQSELFNRSRPHKLFSDAVVTYTPSMMSLFARMSWRWSWSFLGSLVLFMLGAMFGTTGGIFTFFGVIMGLAALVVGLVNFGRNALAPTALIIEESTPSDAIERSKFLTSAAPIWGGAADFAPVTAMSMLFIGSVCYGGFFAAKQLVGGNLLSATMFGISWWSSVVELFVNSLPLLLVYWISMYYYHTAMATKYVERCVQLEGLDIDLLAKEVHAKR